MRTKSIRCSTSSCPSTTSQNVTTFTSPRRAEMSFAAACEQDLMGLPVVRSIFKARQVLLDSEPDTAAHPRGLRPFTKSIGWSVLAEVPGREIVMGAVTQPWYANVVFRPLPSDE